MYVANGGANTVSKFSPGAATPSATLGVPSIPKDLIVDATGKLYVSNFSAKLRERAFAYPTRAPIRTLSVSGYTVSDGNSGGNYAITTVTDHTGSINPAQLWVTATANTRTYDATTIAVAVPTVTGLIGADTATNLHEVYADDNAGAAKTLSVSSYSVGDPTQGNDYSVILVTGTGVISCSTLTITAQPVTKTYDSTTTAAALPIVNGLWLLIP